MVSKKKKFVSYERFICGKNGSKWCEFEKRLGKRVNEREKERERIKETSHIEGS